MGSQTSLLGIMNYFHLNLHAYQVIVTVGDSGLCCLCLCYVFEGYLTPLCRATNSERLDDFVQQTLKDSMISCNKLWKTRRFRATNSERFDDFVQQTLKDSMISCNKLWKTRWFRATNSERLDDFEQQTLKQIKTKFCGEINMTFSRTCVCRVKLQAPVYTFCKHCCVCVCRLRQA